MSARKLSSERIEEAVHLREERGWSLERIGRWLGVSASCINRHCLKLGADAPRCRARTLPQTAAGPALVVRRDGVVVRRFSPEEDAQISALEAEGFNPTEIGRRIGRSPHAVTARLQTLARHAERAAEAAAQSGAPA